MSRVGSVAGLARSTEMTPQPVLHEASQPACG